MTGGASAPASRSLISTLRFSRAFIRFFKTGVYMPSSMAAMMPAILRAVSAKAAVAFTLGFVEPMSLARMPRSRCNWLLGWANRTHPGGKFGSGLAPLRARGGGGVGGRSAGRIWLHDRRRRSCPFWPDQM